jgi:hypothetical protein
MTPDTRFGAQSIGDVLKKVVRKEGLSRKTLKGRRLAQKILDGFLKDQAPHAHVVSVRVGVVTIETDASALFQELESFQRHALTEAFRAAGLKVREVRVALAH